MGSEGQAAPRSRVKGGRDTTSRCWGAGRRMRNSSHMESLVMAGP